MSLPERCEVVQGRLSDALLARETAAVSDREHAERCDACGEHQAFATDLARAMAADSPPDASDALVSLTLIRARAELSRREAAQAAPLEGFRGELGRLLGVALLPLPLVLLWNAAVLGFGGELLAGLLPSALLRALGTGYVMAGVTWLACLYGSLPLLAHRQLNRRTLEAAT